MHESIRNTLHHLLLESTKTKKAGTRTEQGELVTGEKFPIEIIIYDVLENGKKIGQIRKEVTKWPPSIKGKGLQRDTDWFAGVEGGQGRRLKRDAITDLKRGYGQ